MSKAKNIRISYPAQKEQHYLKRFNLSSFRAANYKIARQLFAAFREDYLIGELLFDEFSALANRLWWESGVMARNQKRHPEFYKLLQLVGELSFYARAKTAATRKLIPSVLNRALTSYKK